jgi:hypothetical protein
MAAMATPQALKLVQADKAGAMAAMAALEKLPPRLREFARDNPISPVSLLQLYEAEVMPYKGRQHDRALNGLLEEISMTLREHLDDEWRRGSFDGTIPRDQRRRAG